MVAAKVEDALNNQVRLEAESSQFYLAMASWAETEGLNGVAEFLYLHSAEERQHMLRLVRYINERGGRAIIPALPKPPVTFESMTQLFENLLSHEVNVSEKISEVVDICLSEKDYITHNFMQWYVAEQIEEEALARTIMDKLKMIDGDKGGLYMFDRDIASLKVISAADANSGN